MCSAHPRKGDLEEFPGLTAEEEEHQQLSARAQLGAILYGNPAHHKHFSKQLLHYADAEFVPSPPTTPQRKRMQAARRAKRAAAAPAQAEEALSSEGEVEESAPNESRNMSDLAAFWDDSDED